MISHKYGVIIEKGENGYAEHELEKIGNGVVVNVELKAEKVGDNGGDDHRNGEQNPSEQ